MMMNIGKYVVKEKIGHGGMADVFLAVDPDCGIEIAIKLLKKDAREKGHSQLRQFEHEINTLQQLELPGIVSILDSGFHDDIPYFVMPFFSRGTLKTLLDQRMNYQQASRLLLPVAETLDVLHHQGIIHRDIKPSNLLVNDSGELQLSDFGIAKRQIDPQYLYTIEEEDGIGTPEYMAPEQALGKQIDGRADIYALGVILYQLITGNLPYSSQSKMGVVWQQANQPPKNPRDYVQTLPEQVANTMLKILAVEPDKRFQSMGELAEVLNLIADNQLEQIEIIPPQYEEPMAPKVDEYIDGDLTVDEIEIISRKAKNRKNIVGMFVALIGVIFLSVAFWRFDLIDALQGIGEINSAEKDPLIVQPVAETRQPTILPTKEPSRIPTIQITPSNTPEPVLEVIGSRNIDSLELIKTFENSDMPQVISVASTGEHDYSALGYVSNILYVWNPANVDQKTMEFSSSVNHYTCAELSSDSRYAAAGWKFESNQHVVRVWDITKGSLVRSLLGHTADIQDVDFSSDNQVLASASADNSVIIWDLQSGIESDKLWHSNQVGQVKFSHDDRFLATVEKGLNVRLWDMQSNTPLHSFYPGGRVNSVEFSLQNDKLFIGTDKQLSVWDIGTKEKTLEINEAANFISVNEEGNILGFYNVNEKEIVFLSLIDMGEIYRFKLDFTPFSTTFSVDGTRLIVGSEQGQVYVWGTYLK